MATRARKIAKVRFKARFSKYAPKAEIKYKSKTKLREMLAKSHAVAAIEVNVDESLPVQGSCGSMGHAKHRQVPRGAHRGRGKE